MSVIRSQLEQLPIDLGKTAQELSQFKMIGGHGANLRDQFGPDIFGDGLLVNLGGEMPATLGGVFMQGTLEEVQRLADLAFELILAEAQSFSVFSFHKTLKRKCMRISTHTLRQRNPAIKRKVRKIDRNSAKLHIPFTLVHNLAIFLT